MNYKYCLKLPRIHSKRPRNVFYQYTKTCSRSSGHFHVWLLQLCKHKIHVSAGNISCLSSPGIYKWDPKQSVCTSRVLQVLSSITILLLRAVFCIRVYCVPCKAFPYWLVWRWQQNMPPCPTSHHSKKKSPIFSPSKIIRVYVNLQAYTYIYIWLTYLTRTRNQDVYKSPLAVW
jgi:hypothetical protein